MEFALSENNVRIRATPGAEGFCSLCGKRLIPHRHHRYPNHWAHNKGEECDPWWENQSEWHRNWENQVDEQFRERPIEKNGKKHIADILLVSDVVVELQHTPLSPETRCEREAFYERMIWIIHFPNAKIQKLEKCFKKNWFDDYYVQIKNLGDWIYCPPHECPIFLDIGNGMMFHVTEFSDNSVNTHSKNLYGNYIPKNEFVNSFLKSFYLDIDLNKIKPSHNHRNYALKREVIRAENSRKRTEEWKTRREIMRKEREEEILKKQEEITIVRTAKDNYTWGVWTERDSQASALEEKRRQQQKDPWDD